MINRRKKDALSPRSQHRATLARLGRLIRQCRVLGPQTREGIRACRGRGQEVLALQRDIELCLQRIGAEVGDLVSFAPPHFVTYIENLFSEERLAIDEIHFAAIRDATRKLIKLARRVERLHNLSPHGPIAPVTDHKTLLPKPSVNGGRMGNVMARDKQLSQRDKKLHDLIGPTVFQVQTNEQIRKAHRSVIESNIGIKVPTQKWDGLRSSLNRIRTFHGYPQSKAVRNSVKSRIETVKNGQTS
jgi:hypothetical protein